MLLLLLNGYVIQKRIIIDKEADHSEFFSLIFVSNMCVFVSRPMKLVTFLLKNGETQNGLLIFFGKETHSETNHGNRRGF